MENKYFKYGLIVVVIAVWGAIIYRVAGGLSGPDKPVAAVYHKPKAEAAVVREPFVLFADYPDPFLPEADSIELVDGKKTGTAPGPAGYAPGSAPRVEPPEPTVQSFLTYVGMIGNPAKKLKVAIISLHGKEMLMKEKEKREGIVLRKIDKEWIGVVYKGKYVEVGKAN